MARCNPLVLNGIDVLEQAGFAALAGQRVGLVTNHTGRTRDGRATADVLLAAHNVKLTALFGPEHGIRGVRDEAVDDDMDAATGLPVFSLYGARKRPTPEQCENIDVFVYDIQDIGCRFYTYISTLGNILEAAHEMGKGVIVLDRPNPIGGAISGPLPDADRLSFTAFHPIPIRHGLTPGELALLMHKELHLRCSLEVIALQGWTRNLWFDETNLPWANPSPNMRSLYAALLYPGVGLLEFTNISVGRGTDRPFEFLGAPYINGIRLAEEFNEAAIGGVRAMPVTFTPSASVWSGVHCSGIAMSVIERDTVDPVELGLVLARILIRQCGDKFNTERLDNLLVNRAVHQALLDGAPLDFIGKLYCDDLAEFHERGSQVALYHFA